MGMQWCNVLCVHVLLVLGAGTGAAESSRGGAGGAKSEVKTKHNAFQYSKELSLGNQPLETQRCIWPQFLGNWLAGPSVSKKHAGPWKLSAGFGPSFLETGWLAQEVRFPTLSSLLYATPTDLRSA